MIYTVLRSTAGVAHNKRGGYLIMVAGHLREKKGYFYAVLNYTDAHGNRKTKWIATGLAVKGNKKRAEAFLQEQRRSFPGRCADYRRRSFCRLHGTMAYGNKEFRGGDNFRLILQYGQKSNRAVFQRTAGLPCRSCRQNTSRIFT